MRGKKKRPAVRSMVLDRDELRAVIRLVLRHQLDRRKVYTVGYDGELATVERFTDSCSGCSCDCGGGYPCSHGCSGCDECGYTGKRVKSFPSPVEVNGEFLQVRPYFCSGCGAVLQHFDAGCPGCAGEEVQP